MGHLVEAHSCESLPDNSDPESVEGKTPKDKKAKEDQSARREAALSKSVVRSLGHLGHRSQRHLQPPAAPDNVKVGLKRDVQIVIDRLASGNPDIESVFAHRYRVVGQ
jgi:hypothetical protein